MKNFRTLDQAKKDIQILKSYIDLIEYYEPMNFTQQIIHTYAILGSVQKTAQEINSKGYNITASEVTSHILRKTAPNDALHKKIKSLYRKRIRK